MATHNIYNKDTGQYGYQVPGAPLQAGWEKLDSAAAPVQTAPKAPVGILSTDSAQNTLTKKVDRLNSLSPSTNPSLTAPQYSNSKTGTSGNLQALNDGNRSTADPASAAPAPKAYFTNSMGQEAEFTADQLKTPETQKFLQDQGYVQTKTEGPSYDPGSVAKAGVVTADSQIDKLTTDFAAYNVDQDPAFTAYAASIKNNYLQLKAAQQEANDHAARELETSGIRTGLSRRTNGFSAFKLNALSGMNDKIAELSSKEAEEVAKARKTFQDGAYTQFNNSMNALDKIRDNKQKTLDEYNKSIVDVTKDIREQNQKSKEAFRQSTRDTAVAGLIEQGITDPTQLLEYLNYDQNGHQVGDFTSKEIADTVKNIGGGDLASLTGDVREFYTLKARKAIPASITSLPEDQQFLAYLRQKKAMEKITSDTEKQLTIKDVKDLGLPLSVVGMSQNDILDSLYDDKPPAWFIERLTADQGNDDYADTRWDEYRKDTLANAEIGAGGP